MTETPAPDLRALRELAEAATPGPWALAKWDPKLVLTKRWADDEADPTDRRPWMAANATWEPDAAFIAAANPTAVLALIERVEAAEAAVGRVYEAVADHGGPCLNPRCETAACLVIRDVSAALGADA